jgi:hypothetical protein
MVDCKQSEVQESIQEENFTGLTLCNIKDEWDWVRKGLQEIYDADPDPKQIPEDVYADCRYGRAKLFTMDDKQLFVILSEHRESDELIHLVVWHCWASDRGKKKMSTWLPDVEKYAKQNGYASVMCESVHVGIAEYAIKHYGYFIDTIVIKKFL